MQRHITESIPSCKEHSSSSIPESLTGSMTLSIASLSVPFLLMGRVERILQNRWPVW